MAIFVALIFQVLFVAFAMAINIGLIVHDKINLQNAVDLSVYYAAQRQAEQLNVIAHENYQIRQSFKLLSWRYNVLGSAGRTDHPVNPNNRMIMSEQIYDEAPSVCVSYKPLFQEVGGSAKNESLCLNKDVRIPKIELPGIIAGFNPINIFFQARVISLIKELNKTCQGYGAYNFYFTAASIAAFRRDQANRKQIIYALADNLSKPITAMVDLDGSLVSMGAEKTLKKNLTYENGNNFGGVQFYNSLEGISREDWLHELPISMNMIYTDFLSDTGDTTCKSIPRTAGEAPTDAGTFGANMIRELLGFVQNPPAGDINQLSLGVEKNPWYVVYVGAKATSKPREIFWPFGEAITLEARAFAQPFGGRIGPWYYSTWSSGAKASSGTRVDPLAPPLAGAGLPNNSLELLPNYSRYPGDAVGLHSVEAQGAIPALRILAGSITDYTSIADIGPNTPNDPVAFSSTVAGGGDIRKVELAAIVPDLFDVTYYSIEPRFNRIYLPRLVAAKSALGIPGSVPIRGDLGSRDGAGSIGIKEQMDIANGAGTAPLLRREDYWQLRNREHMLVDWVHGDSFEVMEQINLERFGQCNAFDDDKVATPGSCIDGGRTGYSVKIISPEYLTSGELELGGAGQTGAIANPPPGGF